MLFALSSTKGHRSLGSPFTLSFSIYLDTYSAEESDNSRCTICSWPNHAVYGGCNKPPTFFQFQRTSYNRSGNNKNWILKQLQIREYCSNEWPIYITESIFLNRYWTNKEYLTVVEVLLMFEGGIVIPPELRIEWLNRIHKGHIGIVKCCALASSSNWWSRISSDIEEILRNCTK